MNNHRNTKIHHTSLHPNDMEKKAQVMDKPEEFREVDAAEKKFIQQATGKFLYLGRAIDGTLLTSLSAIA